MTASEQVGCRQCGGQVRFDPASGEGLCAHCGIATAPGGFLWSSWSRRMRPVKRPLRLVRRHGFAPAEESVSDTLPCATCGAELTVAPAIVTDTCPFCGTVLIRNLRHLHRHLAPAGIVPFRLTRDDARLALESETRTGGFAPGIRELLDDQPLTGVYLSFYIFDLAIRSEVTAAAYLAPLRSPESLPMAGWLHDIVVSASETLGLTMDMAANGRVEWDLGAVVGHDTRYLAGFRAALPALGVDEALERAMPLAERGAWALARSERPGVHISSGEVTVEDVRCKLVLLPVWLGQYELGGKGYRIAVNGQTGRVGIEIPVPPDVQVTRFALGVVATLVIGAALVLAVLGVAGVA